MPTQIKVWEIDNGKIVTRDNAKFADSHHEDELEDWIVQNPEIMGENLLIVARQLIVPEVGRLDLLGMDSNGRLVIIELKRELLPRQAVAQALDYASWLHNASEEEILAYANQYLQKQSGDNELNLADAFEETFGMKLPEWICQNHRILLVAAGLDATAERIISYLAQKQIGINAVFFNYCELSDHKQILVRSFLVPESVLAPRIGTETSVTEEALMAMAAQRNTVALVKICRQLRDVWQERSENTAKGSFRYWTNPRMAPVHGINVMVYGINVSGQLTDPPPTPGQLDVWVNTDQLAQASGVAEENVREQLSQNFQPFAAGRMKFVIRLKSTKEAELLVTKLRGLAAEQIKKSAAIA